MKKRNRFIASLLAVAMTASLLASCGGSSSGKKEDQSGKQSADASKDSGAMVFASDEFNAKFSPFFAETVSDTMVSDLVNVQLLQLDRTGSIITKGIEGEKKEYNGKEYTYHGISDLDIKENSDGTVFYDFKLKDGLKFSDGEPFTIDDVIFTMYVLADPTYDGNATFFTLPIQGMDEYRNGVDTLFNLILKAGEGNTDFSKWTEEQQKTFWTDYKKAVDAFVKEITDLCVKNGLNKEGDSIAACAANYGYEGLKDDATAMDFFNAMLAKYDGSVSKMSASESAGTQFGALMPSYNDYQVGVETGESAPNITGIQKTGENSLRIVATKVDAQMIYQLAVTVGALHYYGDKAKFDYDKNQFGFPKGDLSSMREKISKPLGAGAYAFDKYENGVVSLKANDSYYDGAPKVKNLNLKYVAENDKLNSILAGTTDIATPSFTTEVADAIKKANSNGSFPEIRSTRMLSMRSVMVISESIPITFA